MAWNAFHYYLCMLTQFIFIVAAQIGRSLFLQTRLFFAEVLMKRARVYYHIEPSGEAYLDKLVADYHNMVNGVKNIFDSFQKEMEPNG